MPATFRNSQRSAVLLIVMKCNWLTIIIALFIYIAIYPDLSFVLCSEHAFEHEQGEGEGKNVSVRLHFLFRFCFNFIDSDENLLSLGVVVQQ